MHRVPVMISTVTQAQTYLEVLGRSRCEGSADVFYAFGSKCIKGKKEIAYALNICRQRLQEGFREPSSHTDE